MNFRKLLTYLTVGTAAVIPFAGAQNPTILQGSYISNVFGQSNFILNPNAQTNVANVTNATRSTTTPLVATSEFNLSLDAGQNATWTLRAFDSGMKGQNCEARFSYRGFATATTKAEIVQNSLVVAQLVLTPSTDPRIASINFPCGDLANATTFRIAQTTANMTGTNEIGAIYTGLATNMANVAQASKVGGFDNIVCSAEPALTAGALNSFLAPNAAGTCTGTAVGLASAGSSNLNTLTLQFNNLPPGEYVLLTPAYVYPSSVTAGSARCDGRIRETTLNLIDGSNAFSRGNTTEFQSIGAINQFKFQNPTTGNRIFQIEFSRHISTSNCSGGFINVQQNVSLYRFPTSSELVVTPERQNTFAGIKGVANGPTNSVITNAWTKLTSTTTLTRTNFGKAKVETNNDYSITIDNMPVGSYYITATGLFYAAAAGSGVTTECWFGLADTATGGAQIGGLTAISTSDATSANQAVANSTLGGIYTVSSVASKTFFVQSYRSSGNGTCQGYSRSDTPLTISVIPLDQPSNSALYVQGPVLAAATGAAIPSGYLGKAEFGGGSGASGAVSTGTFTVYTISNVTPGVYLARSYASTQRTGANTATYAGYSCKLTTNASLSVNWYDFLNGPGDNFGSAGPAFTGFGSGGHLANSTASLMQIVNVTTTSTYYLRCGVDSNNSGMQIAAGAEFIRIN